MMKEYIYSLVQPQLRVGNSQTKHIKLQERIFMQQSRIKLVLYAPDKGRSGGDRIEPNSPDEFKYTLLNAFLYTIDLDCAVLSQGWDSKFLANLMNQQVIYFL